MRKVWTTAVAATAVLAMAAGCNSGNSDDSGAQAPAVPATSSPAVPTTAPSVTGSSTPESATLTPAPSTPATSTPATSTPATSTPAPSTSSSPVATAPAKLKSGAKGATVVALQQRLAELGYWNGKADGKFGSTTQQAVYALQKTAGLTRDGVVGPKTQKAIDEGLRPRARSKSGSGHVVEINLKKQLLMLVDNGKITQVFNTSTGSNEHYEYEGQTYLADTPSGKFRVGRQIDGWRHGPLGPLWRPKYFNGGIAVHGAPSVPAYPASHGCARLSIAAMNWIWANNEMPLKTRVWVYNA